MCVCACVLGGAERSLQLILKNNSRRGRRETRKSLVSTEYVRNVF